MNVKDLATKVVHFVMQEPKRKQRYGDSIRVQDWAGMTDCLEYFRWTGQDTFINTEWPGTPTEEAPTCFWCAIGAEK